jgi:polysaccharide pyruvyl transferase WcaK-like protein
MLNPCVLHSVRDQYTLSKLQQAGFKNVINTGCPTTWALTPEFCLEIPTRKASEVVTTITDYRRDPQRDNEMLAILSRNYDHVYLWLQGRHDEEYLQTLNIPENLTTIPASLKAYEEALRKGGVDYVGTRLHAGIHALNFKIRSIILAVDNRATEMGRDVNLPVMQRDIISEELEKKINSDFATQIRINQESIDRFKVQFRR